jgi:LacI family transcriptional regulator, galactose operon repressor
MTRDSAARLVDVARLAGVTPAVVSRVLNNDETLRVRPETRERIRAAAAELRYVANARGRALQSARTGTIGLFVPSLTSPVYAAILTGAQRAASERDLTLLLADSQVETASATLRGLAAQGRVDGFLFQRTSEMSDEDVSRTLAAGVPAILLNGAIAGVESSVAIDDEAGGLLATEHLLSFGHRRIGHVAGPLPTDTGARRRAGYERALTAAGIALDERLVVPASDYAAAAGEEAAAVLLAAEPRPTAVFASNIVVAIGVLAAAARMAIRVPEELSVIGLHDMWFAAHTSPPLSTVELPLQELGETAVHELARLLAGENPSVVTLRSPAPRIVSRASVGPAPTRRPASPRPSG